MVRRGHVLLNTAEYYGTDCDLGTGRDPGNLVERDLSILRGADVMLVDVSLPNHQYVGVICEMVYAKQWGIPIVAYTGRSTIGSRLFFRYHCSLIEARLQDALACLSQFPSRHGEARHQRRGLSDH